MLLISPWPIVPEAPKISMVLDIICSCLAGRAWLINTCDPAPFSYQTSSGSGENLIPFCTECELSVVAPWIKQRWQKQKWIADRRSQREASPPSQVNHTLYSSQYNLAGLCATIGPHRSNNLNHFNFSYKFQHPCHPTPLPAYIFQWVHSKG